MNFSRFAQSMGASLFASWQSTLNKAKQICEQLGGRDAAARNPFSARFRSQSEAEAAAREMQSQLGVQTWTKETPSKDGWWVGISG